MSAPDLVPAADPAEHLAAATAAFEPPDRLRARRASGPPPAGSTSSGSTWTTTAARCCRSPSSTAASSPRAARDDGRWRRGLAAGRRRLGGRRRTTSSRAGSPAGPATRRACCGRCARRGTTCPGLDLLVDGRVPVGAGLSSSASLTCGVAVAVADLAGLPGADADDDAGRRALADACVRAENEFAGAPTGGMDQAVVLRAREGHALLLDCTTFDAEHVPLPLGGEAGVELLVVDTRAHHSLVDGRYGGRRQACETAAAAPRGGPARRRRPRRPRRRRWPGSTTRSCRPSCATWSPRPTACVQVAALLRGGPAGRDRAAAARLPRLDARRLPDLRRRARPRRHRRRSSRARSGPG